MQTGADIVTESISNESGGSVGISGIGTTVMLHNNFENDGDLSVTDNAVLDTGSLVNNGTVTFSDASHFDTTTLVNNSSGVIDAVGALTNIAVAGVFENRGALTLRGDASVVASTFEQYEGKTELQDATLAATATGVDIHGGLLVGAGTIDSDLSIFGSGTLSPGTNADPIADFVITGDAELLGTFIVDIEGLGTGQYDRAIASGHAQIGGAIDVNLLGGFAPNIGDFFDIVLAASVAGDFVSLGLPVFDGRTFEVIVGPDVVRLAVVNVVPIPAPFFLMIAGTIVLLGQRRHAHLHK